MASVSAAAASKNVDWPLSNPWTWMLTGLTTAGLAYAWTRLAADTVLAGGIVALLLLSLFAVGIALWVGGPAAKISLVGICIAIDFVCHGVSWSALALAERRRQGAPAS